MIYIGFESIGIDLGTLLLVLSLAAFIFDIILIYLGEIIEKWEEFSEISLIVGCSTFFISFLYFSYSIISGDYSYFNVSEYVSNDMDFFLRLSAIWSSQAGSFFFWGFLIIILYLVFRNLFRKYIHETFFWRSFMLIAVQVSIMIILTMLSDPFRLNTETVTDGLGLNPLLMNIWNVIHPPIIFIGDALCLIPMAIAIARISILENGKVPDFEGKEKLDNFFEFMVSLSWLILSSGIIIGGYWAYITLGWGGFWAWDPVETASLIPWLFITMYYHGKPFFRKRDYFGNYIVSMSYIGALFVTYITRSGVISSVHAFRPEATLERLLAFLIPEDSFIMAIILRFLPEERMVLLFIVILVTFLIPLYFGIKSKEIKRIPFSLKRKDFQVSRAQVTALKISFISLFVGTYIIILGLVTPVIYDMIGYLITFSSGGFGSSIVIDQLFYNTVITIFGAIMLLAQFFCTFYPKLAFNRKVQLLGTGLITGILFALSGNLYRNGFLTEFFGNGNPIIEFFSNFWTTSDKANFIIPLLLFGVVGLVIEFIKIAMKEEKHLIRKTSRVMLHLSFLLILLGALMSTNTTISTEVMIQEGQVMEIPGTSYSINIFELEQVIPASGTHGINYDTKFIISTKDRTVGLGLSRLFFDKWDRMGTEVTIIRDFVHDIYIVTTGVYPGPIGEFATVRLQIKFIPYINILWIGCLFLHFAIIPLTIGRFILLRESFSSSIEEKKEELNLKDEVELKTEIS